MRRLERLAVIGVGLIGGSLALALRRAGAAGSIAGYDRDSDSLARAVSMGVLDEGAHSAAEAARGADLVVLAVPVRAIAPVMRELAQSLGPDAVVTDVGSTKADVVRTARSELRERFVRFVPGHPIAGRESSGVDFATPDLFRGARVVLTPVPETAPDALELVRGCWEAAHALPTTMEPERHDRVFAAVSHLPHLLSFALVSDIAARSNAEELLSFAAGGFRDFTRIAASSPEMWRDIALQNREALLSELDRYGERLAVFRDLVERGDAEGLERLMAEARAVRRAWDAASRPPAASE